MSLVEQRSQNACPVCGYPDLFEPFRTEGGSPSFEICPSCGTEFGYTDFETSHEALRMAWLQTGAKWHSRRRLPPEGWDGKTQCENAFKA